MIDFVDISEVLENKNVVKSQMEDVDCGFYHVRHVRIWLYVKFLDKSWSLLPIEAKTKSTKLFGVMNYV